MHGETVNISERNGEKPREMSVRMTGVCIKILSSFEYRSGPLTSEPASSFRLTV
jgi:hypothetical protein